MAYDFLTIESRWQRFWSDRQTFRTPNPGQPGFSSQAPRFYILDMFPYPSGVGLHVGHPLGYIATDIVARYKRMRGFAVLHPMGYDAFGLPAEQFAVEHGVHPAVTTQRNIDNMTRQLRRLGLSYDWDRSFATTDPGYYRWTQWVFLQLYHSYVDPVDGKAHPIGELIAKLENEDYYVGLDGELVVSGIDEDLEALGGVRPDIRKWTELDNRQRRALIDEYRLAYLDEIAVNWCPALGTVLANEEVTAEGRSERGNHRVFQRPLKQWMLRITAYADRLVRDLDLVQWPESVKMLQRNWIGRSEGARVEFALAPPGGTLARVAGGGAEGYSEGEAVTVFTTRPDTLFGATYMVLAPEHPMVDAIVTADRLHEVEAYRRAAAAKTDEQRSAEAAAGAKTGVFTGAYAVNPVNNDRVPIWIADYVMMGYGTGAIMAVPAHDPRDFDFARQFGLPVKPVVMPPESWFREHAPAAAHGEVIDRQTTQELLDIYLCDPGQFRSAFCGQGVAVHSRNDELSLDGLPTAEAKDQIVRWLEQSGRGRGQTQYKLRDWLFSRQRYWGEPFPVLHEIDPHGRPTGVIETVDESELPVELPPMDDFAPGHYPEPGQPGYDPDADAPRPPLSRAPDAWKYVQRNGRRYVREFNTMPQWAGSCWYYLRFCDPHNADRFVGDRAERYWMSPPTGAPASDPAAAPASGGVDLYVGGVEHAVLHLLYARFWHKVLFDLGHVSTPEPFARLFNQGYIQAYAYTDPRGVHVPAEEVVDQDGRPALEVQSEPGRVFRHKGTPVTQVYGKMGKSLKNAIAPDAVCEQYGCDTLRLYEMYLGPLDQSKAWSTRDIVGVHRFLQRLWRVFVDETTDTLRVSDEPTPQPMARLLHKTVKRVTEAMESMSFNVAIAALIELNNELVGKPAPPRQVAQTMTLLLAPMAPHIAEELWNRLGHTDSLARHPWPEFDPAMLVEDTVEYPVQVNGKLRGKITVPASAVEDDVRRAVLADPRLAEHLRGKTLRKLILIQGKMVNVVV